MAEEISIHDNLVLSYTVDCRDKKIIIHTAYDAEPYEYTDIVFLQVAGYHFENDNFGTILFGIDQAEVEEVYLSYTQLFERRKNDAWPFVYVGKQDLLEKLGGKGVKGFFVSSSYGLTGFVLAEEMQTMPSAGPC